MNVTVTVVVGCYFAALVAWNARQFFAARSRGSGGEETYLGARNFGTGALVATLVAVYASNYTLLAGAESGFRYGLSGPIWYSLAVALPVMLFVWPVNFVRRMRRNMPHGVTMVEYFGLRYDERTRIAALGTVLLASLLHVVSIVVAIGIVLSSLLDVSATTGSLIGGGVLVLYTAFGGYEGTVRSHVFQLVIAGVAVSVTLALGFAHVGLDRFVASLKPGQENLLAWGPAHMLNFLLTLSALALANPILWQRIFSARDEKSASRAMLVFPWLWIPFALGSGLMGMMAFLLMPHILPEQAAMRLVVGVFPAWAAVLFLLGGLALIFSTGDAAINNIASIVEFDVFVRYFHLEPGGRSAAWLGFGLQIGLGIAGMICALFVTSILHLLIVASAINIALLLPLLLGLAWPRSNARAAFWSIVASLAVGAAFTAAGHGPEGDLAALLLSGVAMLGVSRWFPGAQHAAAQPTPARHIVTGVAVALAAYAALFLLASALHAPVWTLPGATVYGIAAYALAGCLILALVLPFFVARKPRADGPPR